MEQLSAKALFGCMCIHFNPHVLEWNGMELSLIPLQHMWIEMNTCTSKQALREYLLIWGLIDDLVLQPTVPDQHKWKLSISGTYSSRSAYNAFFFGSIRFAPWKRIWRSWAPLRCKFFFGWPLTTGVGQLIALPSVGFLTRQHARFVIRLRKIFNTSSSHACSPDRFGP